MWTSTCASLPARAGRKPFRFDTAVHKDLTERLPHINKALHRQTRRVLDVNKAERHLRGGIATMRKFQHLDGKK